MTTKTPTWHVGQQIKYTVDASFNEALVGDVELAGRIVEITSTRLKLELRSEGKTRVFRVRASDPNLKPA